MNERECFDIWAPAESAWTEWAKPVLFAQLREANAGLPAPSLMMPEVRWAPPPGQTAVVVDLPGASAVSHGLALARAGYRPVPLFNTSPGNQEIVPTAGICTALKDAAGLLGSLRLDAAAPPAFLLDSWRLTSKKNAVPGSFDNRWMVFPQDFPSGRRLKAGGIEGVIVAQSGTGQPSPDLAHVLRRWQDAGLDVRIVDAAGAGEPVAATINRPSMFGGVLYRALMIAGLRRNSAGGFGSMVPRPSSGIG